MQQLFDKFKAFALAGVIAAILGVTGIMMLAAAMAALLAIWLPWPGALAVTAVGFLAVSAIVLWVGFRPARPQADPEDEDEVGVDEMADELLRTLVDVPVDVARRIVIERPVATLAVLSGLGVVVARRPVVILRLIDRLIDRFV